MCRCTPNEGIKQLETRLLVQMVNHDVHAIRCAEYGGQKAQIALRIGRLCKETGHEWWAVRLWKFAIGEIHDKDYNDWIDVWFNNRYVSLRDVISDGSCEVLGRCIDEVNRRRGWEQAGKFDSWEYWAGDGWYDGFRQEKFDSDWNSQREHYIRLRDEAVHRQATERLFREGQGETPPQAQNFFHYWEEDSDFLCQELFFKVDDWD